MPVPSTMIGLSDTVVGTPNSRVVAAQNFIMIAGPTANDVVDRARLAQLA